MDWEEKLKDFRLFPFPRRSSSKSSSSLYFGIKKSKDSIIILQYLPKNSKTSYHFHQKLKERHIVLSGKCYIQRDRKLRLMKSGEMILPGEKHRLVTKDEGCLMFIEIFHQGLKNWKKDKVLA